MNGIKYGTMMAISSMVFVFVFWAINFEIVPRLQKSLFHKCFDDDFHHRWAHCISYLPVETSFVPTTLSIEAVRESHESGTFPGSEEPGLQEERRDYIREKKRKGYIIDKRL